MPAVTADTLTLPRLSPAVESDIDRTVVSVTTGPRGYEGEGFPVVRAFAGVSAAAATVFFAYIGFDAITTTAEEARNPQRDLPLGIMAALGICTLLYVGVTLVINWLGHGYLATTAQFFELDEQKQIVRQFTDHTRFVSINKVCSLTLFLPFSHAW